MKEIADQTNGSMEMGPGTLYRSIKQLLEGGLITEVDPGAGGSAGWNARRRTYGLTAAGEIRVADEARRLRDLVRWAQDVLVLEGGRP
jgi:DNA-binding PadR family transcriptional regulator